MLTYINGKVGINTIPVEGSELHLLGDATLEGDVHATGIVTSNDFRIGFNGVPFSSQFATLEYTRIKAFGKLRFQVFPNAGVTVNQIGLSALAVDLSNGTLYFNLNQMTHNGIIMATIVETAISQATYGGWLTTATGSYTYNGNIYNHRITCWIPPANQILNSSVSQKQLQNFDFCVF